MTPTDAPTRNLQFACKSTEYYLGYAGRGQPAQAQFELPSDCQYRADIIDAWDMTITPVEGLLSGPSTIRLPGKPYIAVRLQRV